MKAGEPANRRACAASSESMTSTLNPTSARPMSSSAVRSNVEATSTPGQSGITSSSTFTRPLWGELAHQQVRGAVCAADIRKFSGPDPARTSRTTIREGHGARGFLGIDGPNPILEGRRLRRPTPSGSTTRATAPIAMITNTSSTLTVAEGPAPCSVLGASDIAHQGWPTKAPRAAPSSSNGRPTNRRGSVTSMEPATSTPGSMAAPTRISALASPIIPPRPVALLIARVWSAASGTCNDLLG